MGLLSFTAVNGSGPFSSSSFIAEAKHQNKMKEEGVLKSRAFSILFRVEVDAPIPLVFFDFDT